MAHHSFSQTIASIDLVVHNAVVWLGLQYVIHWFSYLFAESLADLDLSSNHYLPEGNGICCGSLSKDICNEWASSKDLPSELSNLSNIWVPKAALPSYSKETAKKTMFKYWRPLHICSQRPWFWAIKHDRYYYRNAYSIVARYLDTSSISEMFRFGNPLIGPSICKKTIHPMRISGKIQ